MCQNLDGGFVIKAAPPPPPIARVNTLQQRRPPPSPLFSLYTPDIFHTDDVKEAYCRCQVKTKKKASKVNSQGMK
ncbi:hypothetical protein DAPPUDRAFT_241915 [Daphnia pulex]|uniref:Uncharacterized protein n=1 Tax=Daphnia pulex TaxID=6669 RepID=E9GFD4_DAPPU|nr:hypothetical protein DAPPUDRAFT_241915 [Daphnia pulex]|eukprot:EFX81619.1 hypothetical protein DAPPUDRAFT_241915 [Daphnia pulex]